MLILRLSGASPRPWVAELHPHLTVVDGVDPEVAGRLRAAVDALVRGRISGPELAAAGLGGRVVVDGVEVGLEDLADRAPGLVRSPPRTHADLVGPTRALGAARAQTLEAEVDAAAAALAEADAGLARARMEWATVRGARTARVTDGWRARADAAATLRTVRRRTADANADVPTPAVAPPAAGSERLRAVARERLEAARAAHDAAVAALAEGEDLRDHAVAAGRRAEAAAPLRAELDAIEHELARTPVAPAPSLDERRAATERQARLAHDIDQIALAPTDRVASALDDAATHGGIAAVEAAQVAVEWERVRDLVAEQGEEQAMGSGIDPGATPAGPDQPPRAAGAEVADRVRRARDQVDRARRGLAAATSSAGLDPVEVEALEAAHAEVLDAWEHSERRIGVGKARRRLEDAQQAEREILRRLSFASYTEFMMSGRSAGPPSTLDVDHARRTLAESEAWLAEAESEAAAPPPDAPRAPTWDAEAARGRMAATLDALRARAEELLGEEPWEDVAAHLRERIATDPVSDLRLALDEAGLPLGEILSRDEVLARARAWLAQQQGAAARRAALASEQVEADDHLARLEAAEAARTARNALVRRRDELRADVAEGAVVAGAVEAAEARVAQDRAEAERAATDRDEADEAARVLDEQPGPTAADEVVLEAAAVDLSALEAASRDAQTALDVAVSHLLPARGSGDDGAEADAALGRAQARVELARMELAGWEQIRTDRGLDGLGGDDPVAADTVIWQVLAAMASLRDAAPDGAGPSPLVLDEPFGDLGADDVAQVCDALIGPARTVQTILLTSRPEVGRWLEGIDPAAAMRVDTHRRDAGAPA